jgi:hypothetical protein
MIVESEARNPNLKINPKPKYQMSIRILKLTS